MPGLTDHYSRMLPNPFRVQPLYILWTMKPLGSLASLIPLSLLFLSPLPSLAVPPISPQFDAQAVFSQKPISGDNIHGMPMEWMDDAKKAILNGKKNLERWYHKGREYIKQDNLLYEYVTHTDFEKYSLRITEPKICDPSVKQYSGYLDVAEDKHLFFWFFESRTAPATAPLILWLNGGPGCSSSAGLLIELGPCSVYKENSQVNVSHNPYSWNNDFNIIFLDQPVNVGFSYGDDGTKVSNTPAAGKDVYAFLELFLNRYPEYSTQPFHIAAESYGGMYAPNFASIIYKANKDLALAPKPKVKHINLASVMLGNGLTDPHVQMGSVPDYACSGPYPIYDDPEGPQCMALRTKVPTCQRLIKSCYQFKSQLTCTPAVFYCNSQIMGPLIQNTNINPYDIRIPCNKEENGDLCYAEMGWVDSYLNQPSVKAELGVSPEREFTTCNMEVNMDFTLNGDWSNNALLLPELVNGGVRLLVYAGNADLLCNYMGNERWLGELDTQFLKEFKETKPSPWFTMESGRMAGEVRSAGGGGVRAGNVTFVNIHEAGHMVPLNQPEAALDLITRWIMDVPISLDSSNTA